MGEEHERKPVSMGDLIFYGEGRSINHVGMYAGDHQVIHASSHKTGVKVSAWDYRAPIKIIDVLSETHKKQGVPYVFWQSAKK